MQKIQDMHLTEKTRVLLRADLNVPMTDGKIRDDMRIRASLPGIHMILETGASLIIASHLGRPDKNKSPAEQPEFSLAPIAAYLERSLGQRVELISTPAAAPPKDKMSVHPRCLMLENIRFFAGETSNESQFAQELAQLCDVFVMDAFGSAHRAHASTTGITHFAPQSCAGLLVQQEVQALDRVLQNPERPLVAILGGAKVSDKLKILGPIAEMSDSLIVGGGIANTFLAAAGKPVGNSLHEADLRAEARRLMKITHVPLPVDVVVADSLDSPVGHQKQLQDVAETDMILDIGEKTLATYEEVLLGAKTILWNGPVGVFEKEPFAAGTQGLARIIADSSAYRLAGGGDTLAAINAFVGSDTLDYVSTGGGAFLEYIEKKGKLPALEALASSSPGSSAG